MGRSIPEVTIIIPLRETDEPTVTLESLSKQTFQNFKTIVVKDQGKGAPWARNEGFKQVESEFVLFSDNDINWKSRALETLLRVLKATPKASYSYGRFKLGNDIWGHQAWDSYRLKQQNYISTMSLIRTDDLSERPWDESVKRLQDWDLWLTLLEQGKRGVYVEDLLFETPLKNGISHNGMNYLDALLEVKKKHNL